MLASKRWILYLHYYVKALSSSCVSECPPVLFEARSRSDLGISFGGVPSVYLHNGIPKQKSVFHIRSLKNHQLVIHQISSTKLMSVLEELTIMMRLVEPCPYYNP